MNIRLMHAAEVVGEATEALAGSGATQHRLLLAAKILGGLTPKEFANFPELSARYADIDGALMAVEEPRYGNYAASVRAMSAPAMARTTQAILELDRAIRATA